MKYKKQPYTKLHHVETRTNDDGTITVEAHLMHNPPTKGKDGKEPIGMAYPSMHDYANKRFTMTADDSEEAAAQVKMIHAAHRHEKGRRSDADEDDA